MVSKKQSINNYLAGNPGPTLESVEVFWRMPTHVNILSLLSSNVSGWTHQGIYLPPWWTSCMCFTLHNIIMIIHPTLTTTATTTTTTTTTKRTSFGGASYRMTDRFTIPAFLRASFIIERRDNLPMATTWDLNPCHRYATTVVEGEL